MAEKQTDFDDEPVEPIAPKDLDGVPYCRLHHCRMKQSSGGKKGNPTSYLKCPVPDCKETAQMIKTNREKVVPPSPIVCPRCKGSVHCERDPKNSDAAKVVVKCPKCEWASTAMVTPSFASQHLEQVKRQGFPPPGIGDR